MLWKMKSVFKNLQALKYESRLRNSCNCLLMQVLLFLILSLLQPYNTFCSQVAPGLHNLSIQAEKSSRVCISVRTKKTTSFRTLMSILSPQQFFPLVYTYSMYCTFFLFYRCGSDRRWRSHARAG